MEQYGSETKKLREKLNETDKEFQKESARKEDEYIKKKVN
jgi:hypothetical protein